MKITRSQLKKLIKEEMGYSNIKESMMQHQGDWNAAANVPPEAFGGGGPERMKEIVINEMAKSYGILPETLKHALGKSIDLTYDAIQEILIEALVKARKSMPFNDRYGPGKEEKIGQQMLKVLHDKISRSESADQKSRQT